MLNNIPYNENYVIVSAEITKKHHVNFNIVVDEFEITEFNAIFKNIKTNELSNRSLFGINNPKILSSINTKHFLSNNTNNYLRLSNQAIFHDNYLILPTNFGQYYNSRTLAAAKKFFQSILLSRKSENFIFDDIDLIKNKSGYIKFVEKNGWERETWSFYLPIKEHLDDLELIESFSKKINSLKFTQMAYESSFNINLANIYNEKHVMKVTESCSCGYMAFHNLCKKSSNIQQISDLIKLSDNELIDFLYKGGISKVFEII